MKLIRLFVFSGFLAVLASCTQETTKQTTPAPERLEPVKIMILEPREITRTIEYSATLQPYEEIHLVPSMPGRIERIYVETGDRVRKGDLLVEMDRTQLRQAEIQLATLESDFVRFDTLRRVGSIAIQQYDQLKSQLEVVRNNVRFLKENTMLKAPFNGIVSGKYFENGEFYSGAPVPAIGKPAVITLVQIERLKAMVPISESYFPRIKNGMEATIAVDVYPGETFTGRISNISPTIDPLSRTFNVEVTVQNPSEKLRPGMFARVILNLDRDFSLLLPDYAVLKMQGSNDRYLFVEKDGIARRIPVKIVNRYNDMVELESDQLRAGDRIIVSGQSRLTDGAKVKVVND